MCTLGWSLRCAHFHHTSCFYRHQSVWEMFTWFLCVRFVSTSDLTIKPWKTCRFQDSAENIFCGTEQTTDFKDVSHHFHKKSFGRFVANMLTVANWPQIRCYTVDSSWDYRADSWYITDNQGGQPDSARSASSQRQLCFHGLGGRRRVINIKHVR